MEGRFPARRSRDHRAGALFGAAAAAVVASLAWGWFEAGWVRFRRVRCPVLALPDDLAGMRIVHLSDFHLGMPSRGVRAVEKAVGWAVELRPDLVAVTGDLLSRPAGADRLLALLARIPQAYAVLGNHDYALGRDPFSKPVDFRELPELPVTLLVDESRTVELRGRRVQIVGVDARSWRRGRVDPEQLADPGADLRILLCHFPDVIDRLPPGAFHLVLSGHLHDGQIAIPYGRGRFMLKHPKSRYVSGLLLRPSATLHVSPGLGTTLVPFRLFARPEATELTLVPLAVDPAGPPDAAAVAPERGLVGGRRVRRAQFRPRPRRGR